MLPLNLALGVGLGFCVGLAGVAAPPAPTTLLMTFGALTRSGAGAALPVDGLAGATNLAPVAATITTQDPTNPTHWQIVGGNKLAPAVNGPLAASYALTVTYDGVPIAVTINTIANAYSVASVAEGNTAFGLAAASPTLTLDVYFRSATYGALNPTIAMSGTIAGVPPMPGVFIQPHTYRNFSWNPSFTGGQLRIRSHKGYEAIFAGASGQTSCTGVWFDNITYGRLSTVAQYAYEPEAAVNITAVARGNPTVITVANIAGFKVGAKVQAGSPTGNVIVGATWLTAQKYDITAISGNQITVSFDSSALADWVSGGDFSGSSLIDSVSSAWTPSGSQSTFIFSSRLSSKDINPDAAWWGSGVAQGPYKLGVFYGAQADGVNTAFSVGRGFQTLFKEVHVRNCLQDYIAIRSTTASSITPHTAVTKAITGVSNATACVITCVGHGLVKDDTIVISSVAGATLANNNSGGSPAMWGVYDVIDADHFYLGKLGMGTGATQGTAQVDSSAWGVYTSGGTMNGPLWVNMFIQHYYAGPQAADARFTAIHSDGLQQGSPNNEVNMRGAVFDSILAPIAGLGTANSTQSYLGGGAEIDSTRKKMQVWNLLTLCTTINGIIPMVTRDWWSDYRFCTVLHWATTLFPTLGATFKSSARKSRGGGILCGDYVNQGGGVMTGLKNVFLPTFNLSTAFAGNFAADGRGYYYDQDAEPTGTVMQILQAYANRYKGIGAYANLGFGADPACSFFTGTADNTPAVISGLTFTPDAFNINVNYSINTDVAFVSWVLSTSNALTEAQVLAEAQLAASLTPSAGIMGGNVLGVTASGAQPVINPTSLSPSTAYYFYMVVERLQGATTFTGAQAVSTTAITGVPIQQVMTLGNNSGMAAQVALPNVITIGNAADRALLVAMTAEAGADTADFSAINMTFGAQGRALNTGTALTLLGMVHAAGPKRARVLLFGLLNPPSGQGTIQVMSPGALPQSGIIYGVELANAKQNLANWIVGAGAGGTGNVTARSEALTSLVANCVHLGAVCVQGSSGVQNELAASNSATMWLPQNTGGTALSDNCACFLSKAVPAAASDTIGATWVTANVGSIITCIVPPEH